MGYEPILLRHGKFADRRKIQNLSYLS
ncbi:hypothetical protein AGR13a_Lc30125 [Agrobacterium genomosp. 13 str. CFBP 6927]|uniref:Transposase n=1 Tax=Agrobacterium genomosp. 13 str. CFBP 6927 TaxID=1183428 RepID=A0ABM9VLG3_9HYPH|nr:hypothetical protein AGR13a_Lc30125 [Agrobacterium genomosp. 13 str. CFBP 6927]